MAQIAENDGSQDAPTLPKKRSIFNKPKRTNPTDTETNLDLFSRSKELFPIRVAEAERRRQEKLERSERKRNSSGSERELLDIREGKKKRLSQEAKDPEYTSELSANEPNQDDPTQLRR